MAGTITEIIIIAIGTGTGIAIGSVLTELITKLKKLTRSVNIIN